MTKLRSFIQIARERSRHYSANAGSHPLHGAGGNQHRQTMRGHGEQGRYHKNRHADEDYGAAPNPVGKRAVKQLRDAVGQEVSSHYALDGAFPDV